MTHNTSGGVLEDIKGVIRRSVQQFGLSTTLELLIQAVTNRGVNYLGYRGEQLMPYVKMAWNYEEAWRSSYSLEEAITWVKSNMPGDASAGCLFRILPDKSRNYYRLHHCFLDAERKPLLDGEHPHKVVNAYVLSDSLARQFGEKDMLLFR